MLGKETRIQKTKKRTTAAAARARKEPRQERARATTEAILEAAARILERHGLAGYNTNAIAERAGVSIGSLYQYYPNKDAITVALVERDEAELAQTFAEAVRRTRSVRLERRMENVVAALYHHRAQRAGLQRVLKLEEDRLARSIRARTDGLELVRGLLADHAGRLRVPVEEAARDVLTVARAMLDEVIGAEASEADAVRRTTRAVLGYLLWKG